MKSGDLEVLIKSTLGLHHTNSSSTETETTVSKAYTLPILTQLTLVVAVVV